MRVLVVSEWFPYPPVAGAKIRAYSLICQLARLADIDLIAQVNTLTSDQLATGTEHLKQFCGSVESVPAIPYRRSLGKALRLLVDPLPATVRHRRNLALEQLLVARLTAVPYDAVVATISGAPSATLHSLIELGARPIVADSLELGVLRPSPTATLVRRARSRFIWRHLRRYTRRVLEDIALVTVTSDIERTLFTDLLQQPDQCLVVPNVLDLRAYVGDFGPRDHNSLLYAGSFSYSANYDAVMWFAQQVFQLIAEHESLKVRVTGNTAGRDLAPLRQACPQIEFTGFVDDIRPYFAQSGICIVPILAGGSTRLKIIEAMAWGTPVVSTRIGAEGLDVTHGQNILLADTPGEFAACIERLLHDPVLWKQISVSGRALVADRYSAETMSRHYRAILSRVTRGA